MADPRSGIALGAQPETAAALEWRQLRERMATIERLLGKRSPADRDLAQAGLLAPQAPGYTVSTQTQTANRGWFSRFVPSRVLPVLRIGYMVSTAATANDAADFGIYVASGANLTKVVSLGATQGLLNAGTGPKNTPNFPGAPIVLSPDTVYYAAFSYGTIGAAAAVLLFANYGSGTASQQFGSTAPNVEVMFRENSHPLPDSITSGLNAAQVAARLAVRES